MSSINTTTAYPLCPYCDIEVEDIETPYYEFTDEIVTFQRVGMCPHCKCYFEWAEIYKWDAKFYDLKEMNN